MNTSSDQKLSAIISMACGMLIILIGIGHNVIGYGLLERAMDTRLIDLPSYLETGFSGMEKMPEELLTYTWRFSGYQSIVLGLLLIIMYPNLKKGDLISHILMSMIGFFYLISGIVLQAQIQLFHPGPIVFIIAGSLASLFGIHSLYKIKTLNIHE